MNSVHARKHPSSLVPDAQKQRSVISASAGQVPSGSSVQSANQRSDAVFEIVSGIDIWSTELRTSSAKDHQFWQSSQRRFKNPHRRKTDPRARSGHPARGSQFHLH